mmetsp:Transcript_25793/g.68063  ORF Transcript_25793/g.68063 Transcript_25793/m.68063 type:complete len:113 (-) Transcript_25793:319-657(-)
MPRKRHGFTEVAAPTPSSSSNGKGKGSRVQAPRAAKSDRAPAYDSLARLRWSAMMRLIDGSGHCESQCGCCWDNRMFRDGSPRYSKAKAVSWHGDGKAAFVRMGGSSNVPEC